MDADDIDSRTSRLDHRLFSLPAGAIVTQIAGDEQHMVALLQDGRVYRWGRLVTGFGTRMGATASAPDKVPAEVAGLPKRATAVAAGFEHACALIEDGVVWCWGNDEDGELGRGDVDGGRGVLMAPAAVAF